MHTYSRAIPVIGGGGGGGGGVAKRMFRILACVQKKHKTTACSVLLLQEGHGMRPDRILMWYILRSDLFLWNRWYIQHLVPLYTCVH